MKFYYNEKVKPVGNQELKYYHYQLGIAGYSRPQGGKHFLFHGTDREFGKWLKERTHTTRVVSRSYGQQLF